MVSSSIGCHCLGEEGEGRFKKEERRGKKKKSRKEGRRRVAAKTRKRRFVLLQDTWTAFFMTSRSHGCS
jgi:hypothetical protein